MYQIICASLSHTHYWYEVGMLKVPATTEVRLQTQSLAPRYFRHIIQYVFDNMIDGPSSLLTSSMSSRSLPLVVDDSPATDPCGERFARLPVAGAADALGADTPAPRRLIDEVGDGSPVALPSAMLTIPSFMVILMAGNATATKCVMSVTHQRLNMLHASHEGSHG